MNELETFFMRKCSACECSKKAVISGLISVRAFNLRVILYLGYKEGKKKIYIRIYIYIYIHIFPLE